MNFETLQGLAICVTLLGFIIYFPLQFRLVRRAKRWPTTEANIQSGIRETVTNVNMTDITLPVFAFTYYVAKECYSGRFSLYPYITDPPKDITERLTNTKIPVHYNPTKPAQWFISIDLIEGCKVKQKIGPHIMHLYPD